LVRVAEALAGSNWGGQFIPRAGTEVLVDFIDGDMDRSIIVGQLYTGSNLPPYSADVDSGVEHAGVLSGYHTNNFDGGSFNQMVTDDSTRLATSSTATELKLGYHSRSTKKDRSDCKRWQSRARYQRKQKIIVRP
jgi:type VI secretion system secreted protein VgrG